MHQMGLAQAHAAVDEQRVVKMTGRARDMHGRRARHAIGRTFDQRVERQRRIQARAKHRRGRLFRSRAGGDLVRLLLARAIGRIGAYVSARHRFTVSEC
ncbi:hypothetical protein D3C85_1747070 [compost metagenome]